MWQGAEIESPAAGAFRSLTGPVGAIGAMTLIACTLTPDSGAMSAGAPGNHGKAETLWSQSSNGVPFVRGDLVVRHGRLPFLGGLAGLSVFQAASLTLEFPQGRVVADIS